MVVPRPIIARAEKHPLLAGLHVTDAGIYPCATGHRVTRTKGSPGAILIVCTGGGGWVLSQGKRQEVNTGDVVFIAPRQGHAYGANLENPWTIEWVHFSGHETMAWHKSVMNRGFFLHLSFGISPALELAQVYQTLQNGYEETWQLLAAVILRQNLAELLKHRRLRSNLPTSMEAVEATATWMSARLSDKVSLDGLAKKAGMSTSRYSDLFRQRYGFAPLDWFLRQRVRQACLLLDGTQEKIETVGREVGFTDPYYFSRIFRKIMGCSPRAYRSTPKG